MAFFLFVFLCYEWKSWEYPLPSPINHPGKKAKFWTTSVLVGFMCSGLIAIGVGVAPLNHTSGGYESIPCSIGDGGLAAAYIFMVLGFWGLACKF